MRNVSNSSGPPSDQRRRALSDVLADYTFVARFDGHEVVLESASEGFTRVTGYTLAEFNAVGRLALTIHPDDVQIALHGLERLLAGKPDSNEVRIITKAGEVRWLRYQARPERDAANPSILRIHGAGRDITDVKEAGRQRDELEQRFRQLAENINEAFLLSNPSRSQFLYCSPAFETIWGLSCDSLYQQPWLYLEAVYPEDRERLAAALERQAQGDATDVEYRITWPDGSTRWVRDRSFPIKDANGQVYRVAGIADDITERKRSEEALHGSEQRFTRFMHHLPGLAWIKDLQGRYVYINDATEHAFRRPRSDIYGKTDDDLFPPDTAAQFQENDRQAILSGSGVQVIETLEHADGVVHYSIVNKFPILGADGRAVLVGGMAIDVTDRLRAEQALQEADRLKDEFLAMLAHELRNPLAPIRNALHVLKNPDGKADMAPQVLDMAERQVHHMARLLDDLLDVSRISRGKIELRKETLDVAAAVHRATESVRPLFEERGHRLTVSLPPEALRVQADPTRLEQVLTNLLNNAAKYTDPGGEVWVTLERDGQEVVLRVRDTGIGIRPDMLPRIFDLFVQAERRLDRSQGGVGIGLTLVRRLVEMHGGTASAASKGPGHGSEFVVRLPAMPEESNPTRGGRRTMEAYAPSLESRRVLVVDDNVDAANSLALLLRLSGHEVQATYDGPSALLVAEAFHPQVVLLDIGMPGMDGYEVARRLRQQTDHQTAVLAALTGWGQEEDRRRALEAGFDYHFVKPIEPDALEQLLALPAR